MKALLKSKQAGKASMSEICNYFNLKRDAYYKYLKRYKQREVVESQVLELVKMERKEQPRLGTRKLHEALEPIFEATHIKVGRDSLLISCVGMECW